MATCHLLRITTMSTFTKNFLMIVATLLLVAFGLSNILSAREKKEEYAVSSFVTDLREGNVTTVQVKPESYVVTLQAEGQKEITKTVKKEPQENFSELIKNYSLDPKLIETITVTVVTERGMSYWFAIFGPAILPLLIIGLFMFFMSRQIQGAGNKAMSFGQSTAKEVLPDGKARVTFADVAGNKEAKEELAEIVEFLKNPKKFADMGAKIQKGALLMGPPGTGKTLMARAVAGEAQVPFLHMSGSEFVEMFVGVGASRVRDLFERAKKLAPAIVFIDEIDAVGRRRGAGLGGSHDEREQTLNQILVEMDGFEPNSGVIVMAATNRSDVLDSALLRPGRFDRRVTLDLPDIKEREEILTIHMKGKPLDETVNAHALAVRTPGFSGADLANVLNEASILAVRRAKEKVGNIEVLDSIEKVLLGPERKSRVFSERERKMTAFHEAGHALVAHVLKHSDPVRKISIISRGHAGGYTLKMPTEDKHYRTRAEFKDELAVALGGYVTEFHIFGPEYLSTGPSSDLRNATAIAHSVVANYGMMFDLPPRTYGTSDDLVFLGKEITQHRDYSEKTAEKIDEKVGELIEEARKRALDIITTNQDTLVAIVKVLLEKETIEQEEFEKIVGQKTVL